MFNIMICNITNIRIRLSICTSSEVVLSSICSLSDICSLIQGLYRVIYIHLLNVCIG